ncbi:MAG: hypothetical protein E6G45_08145 [Actinobacteria bacterium]|nr:MAG: hypothetical protein E6G45_08145 [Actinomycetota bacterium]
MRKEVMPMNIAKKWVLLAVVAGSMIGGAVGGTVLSASSGNAQSSNSAQSTNAAAPTVIRSGTFKPNESKAHEANESAQREAQEDAGQVPTVP